MRKLLMSALAMHSANAGFTPMSVTVSLSTAVRWQELPLMVSNHESVHEANERVEECLT